MTQIYENIKEKAKALFETHQFLNESVTVTARALSVTEAIGNPEDDDYPIQKGKEKLMQADFKSSFGQAFTDHFGNFKGSVKDVLDLPLTNNFHRAILVSTINAVMRHLTLLDNTVHCHDDEPIECAAGLVAYIRAHYGRPKITQIGLQPRILFFPCVLLTLTRTISEQTNTGLWWKGRIRPGRPWTGVISC